MFPWPNEFIANARVRIMTRGSKDSLSQRSVTKSNSKVGYFKSFGDSTGLAGLAVSIVPNM